MKKLLIYQNLISLHQHRYIVKKNGVERFGKRSTLSNKKFKGDLLQRTKQEAGSLQEMTEKEKEKKKSANWRIKGWLDPQRKDFNLCLSKF